MTDIKPQQAIPVMLGFVTLIFVLAIFTDFHLYLEENLIHRLTIYGHTILLILGFGIIGLFLGLLAARAEGEKE